ncbi:MAG TPA: glycosyltransferase family A protein, partial [Candidatus Synoicihabitans sp.]|nr:glycosyltransferase family A protein [Candidatus Synoicihabitans sp.]
MSTIRPSAQASVLIAAYKAGRFMPAALAAVSAQTLRGWELIVVEDGSHDQTEAVVRAFAASHPEKRIVYDNLGANRGVSAARNRLLELAQGEILAFLDADDLWQPHHLAGLQACLTAGHRLACSAIEIWDADRDRLIRTYAPTTAQLAHPRRALFEESIIQTSSCVALPRAVAVEIGRFDETLRVGEDRDYWFRALAAGGTLGCTGETTCRYTKHSGSTMARTMLVAEQVVRFYEKHATVTTVPRGLRRAKQADALLMYARLLRSTQPRESMQLLRRAWRAAPWRPSIVLQYACSAARAVRH